jgi:hypothetical protein
MQWMNFAVLIDEETGTCSHPAAGVAAEWGCDSHPCNLVVPEMKRELEADEVLTLSSPFTSVTWVERGAAEGDAPVGRVGLGRVLALCFFPPTA